MLRQLWRQFTRFVRGLIKRPEFMPGQVEDSPETVMETERRRGMRGL